MRQSESIAKLAYALTRAQEELPLIKRESVNPFYKSKYADLPTIFDAIRPVLAKHKLAVLQGGDGADTTRLGVSTMLLHESGEFIEYTFPMPCTMEDPQKAGSAITYGRRYGLQSILGIAAEEDDDGNTATRGTQASREGRSAPEGGTGTPEPFTGTCPIHNRAWKHNVGATAAGKPYDFWACPHFDELDGKRVYCKEKPPPSEDQSILDNEPAGAGPEGHPATVDLLTAISDKLGEMGKRTKAAKMLVFHKWAEGRHLDPMPATWEKLSATELVEFADWLDAQTE